MAADAGRLTLAARPAVRISGLKRSFGGKAVLDGVDLAIAGGEFVALLGRSGSGKSTLLRALAGLDHGVAGSGTLVKPGRISMVFQDSRLLPWQRLLANVTFGLRSRDGRARGLAALREVGLAGRECAWPHELSGGEQQRASLARSLVGEPELLLADEPFGALDALTRIRMHALLRRLCERHRPAVLLVTHDVDEAITLADRVLVLDGGTIRTDLAVDLPSPRTVTDPRFARIRSRLLADLGIADPHDDEQTSGKEGAVGR
ncbi:ABC transporter ATP-binding protein [Actinomadura sp. KC216]|uniref:ABC transporter ATP-binding protein n=1 Tax=Actinomadura sp. KC216 TaxID=2530370 RepID=UPI001046B905|nr:ABC transporter ATP-binding protein [Actinomadura sp. KC216]TDB80498.1 ABC transporter ATP-binding protein [Actinomadura sp. KC216]